MSTGTPSPTALWRGVAGITFAVACFATLDGLTKQLTAWVGVGLVLWARCLLQTLVVGAQRVPREGWRAWHTQRPALQALRGLCMLLSTLFAYFSLRHLPVAEFTAILMLTATGHHRRGRRVAA